MTTDDMAATSAGGTNSTNGAGRTRGAGRTGGSGDSGGRSRMGGSMWRRAGAGVLAFIVTAVLSAAAFAAWLGWDQERDVHPDGSTTGPYEPWQVLGLVVVLAAIGALTAWRGHSVAATLGVTVGLTTAVAVDWSDDTSGLWALGASMVCLGTLFTAACVTAIVSAFRPGLGKKSPQPH